MKIIKPSVEFLGAVPTDYASALKFIERCGRVCYKSEDKITPSSAEPFVKRLINAGHLAMVEHSNMVVMCDDTSYEAMRYAASTKSDFLKFYYHPLDRYIAVGGSLRAWFEVAVEFSGEALVQPFIKKWGTFFGMSEAGCIEEFEFYECPHDEIPKELHRYSVKFICDRGVSHELVRHRPCSFAQESTRYVNYGGKDVEFIEPWWMETPTNTYEDENMRGEFLNAVNDAQCRYDNMMSLGAKPQQARAVLPNALKTEIIITADLAEWTHIRKLRTAKDAHPDMQRVMNMVPWEKIHGA